MKAPAASRARPSVLADPSDPTGRTDLKDLRVVRVTANRVDAALAAPIDEVGALLLATPEDQWFDRKSSRIAPKDLAVPLVAFANAEGGTIVVGLHGGKVEGLRDAAKKLNDFRQAPIDFTSPPVRARFSQINCRNDGGHLDVLLVVRVDPSERVHELVNGECYLRIGDESQKLGFQARQELEFDKGQAQYDGMPAPGVAVNDLDGAQLQVYREKTGATRTFERLLEARSLLARDGRVTNAGYLLFGAHPQDIFPQAYIRILRFFTVERGTGSRLGLDDSSDIRVEGSIPQSIQRASDIIEEFVPRRRVLGDEGTFVGRAIVPRDAWLEGLVNAVIHRSYSLGGDHIRVEIYPNRIEIESPGRFPGLADPSRPLDISRFARNPRIARVCADLRIAQELGEGIKRMFEEMRRVGLTDPLYKQSAGSVRLVLAALPRLDPRLISRLPTRSQDVLDLLRASETPLGTGEVAERLIMSRPAVASRLRALEKEGLVRWSGKSNKDPRAVWLLRE
ncbi:Transcriptional regulator [Frankia canadensis]|uniref:Transcriptional regulator n=1 Tax=Frankia canadensis TaxID=1836972 RepID=A0A2I2KKB2_9ACTN|nr:Transcriptional regulator [Frankia canadensis]SOU53374.1 Transcriptional regulator [Frankia canadensis]